MDGEGEIYEDEVDVLAAEWPEAMTLRDWFAGQAFRDTFAALAASGWSNLNDYQIKKAAEASYMAADAMLAARSR